MLLKIQPCTCENREIKLKPWCCRSYPTSKLSNFEREEQISYNRGNLFNTFQSSMSVLIQTKNATNATSITSGNTEAFSVNKPPHPDKPINQKKKNKNSVVFKTKIYQLQYVELSTLVRQVFVTHSSFFSMKRYQQQSVLSDGCFKKKCLEKRSSNGRVYCRRQWQRWYTSGDDTER